ncbi:MAG: hypothetical protein RPU39_13775 [Candidatus Sedimenticola sp. (ex Thyasira tokunagai)]
MIPVFSTEPIELDVVAGEDVVIKHGLGRQVPGFVVVWADAPIFLYVVDPAADSSTRLTLKANESATVKLVLL